MTPLAPFEGLAGVALEITLPFGLLVVFFAVFQFVFLKRPRRYVFILLRGLLFAYVGLLLFLQGINIALMPMGAELGELFGALEHTWILIPTGLVLGFLVTLAEPQVRVLSEEVEEASAGYIRAPVILYTLCAAVAAFAALGMARTVYGIPLPLILIPGYGLALILLFFADTNFVAMAFDAGSIATGPMTVAFIMSLTVGAATAIEGRNPAVDGLGLIGIITLAPIISLQLVSLVYRIRPPRGGNQDE